MLGWARLVLQYGGGSRIRGSTTGVIFIIGERDFMIGNRDWIPDYAPNTMTPTIGPTEKTSAN